MRVTHYGEGIAAERCLLTRLPSNFSPSSDWFSDVYRAARRPLRRHVTRHDGSDSCRLAPSRKRRSPTLSKG